MRPRKPVNPAIRAQSRLVQQAHAHLTKTVPGFRQQPMAVQMKMHQAHIRKMKGA